MAVRHIPWDGKEICDLPPEILTYQIKETPRSTLKDIANKLNADIVSAGNWESLAEKLGFVRSSVLDDLIEHARVQHTYPGLLMLQEWACRPGSTAVVLLHALREIHREDVVGMLVSKLFELHTMQLTVSVEDRSGVLQFLRVRTRKSAPLHASLDNELQNPLYWYDITGPRHDTNWFTPSEQLQGVQLTLKLREEPSQDSRSQIYGTSRTVCQPPTEEHPGTVYHHPSGGTPRTVTQVCGQSKEVPDKNQANHVNTLQLNIPLQEPNISVTFPMDPSAHRSQLNVLAQGPGLRLNLVNNLSPTQQDLNLSQSPDRPFHPPLPPAGKTKPMSPVNTARELDLRDPDSVLNELQPMTIFSQNSCSPDALPHIHDFSTMTSMPSASRNYEFSTSPMGACGGLHMSHTVPKEFCLISHTEAKLKFERENRDLVPAQHDEMDSVGGQPSPDTDKPSPSSSSSLLNADYVAHNSVIQFCNDPTSPQSCGSGSLVTPCGVSATGMTSSERQAPEESSSHFPRQSQTPFGLPTPPPGCSKEHRVDYVPHSFIEEQSKKIQKSASAPQLDEEEQMQAERSRAENNSESAEGMDYAEEGQGFRDGNPPYNHLANAAPAIPAGKPPPCTYTAYRPDMVDHQHHYLNYQKEQPLTNSISAGCNMGGGYLDMSGGHNRAAWTQRQQQDCGQPSSADLLARHGLCSPPSFYLPDDSADSQVLDSDVRHDLDPGLSNFLQPRVRKPLPPRDIFEPRDRRPLTQDHDMLLDGPAPEYTYIDPPSTMARSLPACSSRGPAASASSVTPSTSRGTGKALGVHHRSGRGSSAFFRQLSESQLQQVPGWNPNVTEKTVEQEMTKYINDDGNFIIWYYAVGGKFVISVSHLRSIRHYIVYEKEQDGQLLYYIFPKCPRFTSLADLIRDCQLRGIVEHSETKPKTFKTPDGKEALRFGSGRFSHVRLRVAIPSRRR